MKTIYFVTATNTNIGKTKACEVFLNKFASEGKKVGYFKPIETGVEDNKPLDGFKILNLVNKLNPTFNVSIDDIVLYQFKLPAAPYIANDKKINIDTKLILNKVKQLLTMCDILIVEGAGGLMVPIKEDYFMIDLIVDFQTNFNQLKTLLITPSHLGCINDTLLSCNILKQYNINFNWYVNLYKDKKSFQKTTLPFYENYFKDEIRYL